ncbi:MAG: ammonia channel protein, partial [Salinisphaera sp.]|nr:ammonia channel protein [Salinisphaera sp.]
MKSAHRLSAIALPGLLIANPACAQSGIDAGDTAWVMTATALVLFMTLPGLALFYGGLVRVRNVLSVLMQCFTICCLVTILWFVYGYSLAFTEGNGFIGGFSRLLFAGMGVDSAWGSIPESVFAMFQLTFAIITPALVIGGFAERLRFPALLGFTALWLT